ncbi:MAG: NTP transferase domain-containing protein [Alphaproteobacteria bacterium]|nr:NTP transferase domain-containing protein [Alphaproteobacteria bacterium]
MTALPQRAMVLAAGLGLRMRPLTDHRPKALLEVGGRTLVDWALDALARAGVPEAVVNHHYLGQMLVEHLAQRTGGPRLTLSDETDRLMETGGGVVKALPLLGAAPFFVINADVVWTDGPTDTLRRMAAAWDPERMDALLLLAPRARTIGFDGPGDFFLEPDGRLRRRTPAPEAPFAYCGVQIVAPRLFRDPPDGPFSNNVPWNRALAEGRLYGIEHDGWWLHIGDPAGRDKAEAFLRELCHS